MGKVCSFDGCKNPMASKGLCGKHYLRQRKYGDPSITLRPPPGMMPKYCIIRERGKRCRTVARRKKMCDKHYRRLLKHGDPLVKLTRFREGPFPCKVKDCSRISKNTSRGYCGTHYMRWRKYGNHLTIGTQDQGKGSSHPHYHRWWNMMRRCYNPEAEAYCNYGERGITVCREWHRFHAFRDYLINVLGEPPTGYSLDRIDCDGNYEPGNVRWASAKEQANNRRKNVKVGDTWTDPDSLYICSVCDKNFKSISAFDRHRRACVL